MDHAFTWVTVLPFAGLILSIALLPLLAPRWWEKLRHRALVTSVLSLPIGLLLIFHAPHELARAGIDYLSFIALLGSLFVISGGILLTGDLRATPEVNTIFLAAGAVLANLIGTTGASMLLIRPLLQTISERRKVTHIPIFFIFLVSNIGGALTPLGDPPLFLGFLRGVPFFWTLRLFPVWLFAVGVLLLVFYLLDRSMVRRETAEDLQNEREMVVPLRIRGLPNLLFLGGVLGSVFLPPPLHWARPGIMVLMALGSYFTTPRDIHRGNRFTFYPVREVALLFGGIFVTMTPVLLLLQAHGAGSGLLRPWQYFWLTGGLSSFLDNAPTYLAFASMAQGAAGGGAGSSLAHLALSAGGGKILQAISLGAVFMGACSYIGNVPNFMVKSIAEEQRVRMPGFFGYMVWSLGILGPLFIVVTLIFLL